jgi:nitroreductase
VLLACGFAIWKSVIEMPDPRTEIVWDVIRSRRTVNAFHPELPPRGIVTRALEAACWAPNHKKTEPWRFHWLGPETATRIVELNARIVAENKGHDAAEAKRRQWSAVPGWLLVTCVKSDDAVRHEEDYAACCCAVQNLMLALWSAGVATKWSTGGVTRHPDFFALLDLNPDQHRVVALLWYGYPQAVPEQQRGPLNNVLREWP